MIELYHHTVRAGQFDEALTLYRNRLSGPLYYQPDAYPLIINLLRALFPDGEAHPPRLKNNDARGWALNTLAHTYGLSGQPCLAAPLFERQNASEKKQNNSRNLATGLGNFASMAQMQNRRTAGRRGIELSRKIHENF